MTTTGALGSTFFLGLPRPSFTGSAPGSWVCAFSSTFCGRTSSCLNGSGDLGRLPNARRTSFTIELSRAVRDGDRDGAVVRTMVCGCWTDSVLIVCARGRCSEEMVLLEVGNLETATGSCPNLCSSVTLTVSWPGTRRASVTVREPLHDPEADIEGWDSARAQMNRCGSCEG